MASMRQLTAHPRVESVDDERAIGNGVIVTLKAGWSFDPFTDNRVSGEDTITEMLSAVRNAHRYKGPLDP